MCELYQKKSLIQASWFWALFFSTAFLALPWIFKSLFFYSIHRGQGEVALAVFVLFWLILLFGAVCAYSFVMWMHYDCWSAIPLKYRRVKPDNAVLFMFIPVFNIVWGFTTWPKLARSVTDWQESAGRERSFVLYPVSLVCAILYALIFVSFLSFSAFGGGVAIYLLPVIYMFFLFFYQYVIRQIRVLSSIERW